jgi:hypothetical protein
MKRIVPISNVRSQPRTLTTAVWFGYRHGSLENVHQMSRDAEEIELICDNLRIEASTDPAGGILDIFFEGYDQAFVLPDEKEELSGFRECLALNYGKNHERLKGVFGPFREIVFIARNAQENGEPFVGGANFICFPIACEDHREHILSVNLNYAFVLPMHRGKGLLRPLLKAVDVIAQRVVALPRTAAGNYSSSLIFLELNDPVRLSEAEYALDSRHSGLDQMTRIALWTRLGAKIVDFDYVQPPLSAMQEPDSTLLYAVIGTPSRSLSPYLLREHLRRFFDLSVLKGRDPGMEPSARRQLDELQRRQDARLTIPLLDATALLAERDKHISVVPTATSLRELIRGAGPPAP